MKIDHIGYAVKDLEEAVKQFHELGYTFDIPVNDSDRNVKLLFGQNGEYRIELVARLDVEQSSPIDGILKKIGPTAYHICYLSATLEDDIAYLEQCGFHIIVPPQAAIAFGGRRVAFMMAGKSGMIELLEAHGAPERECLDDNK